MNPVNAVNPLSPVNAVSPVNPVNPVGTVGTVNTVAQRFPAGPDVDAAALLAGLAEPTGDGPLRVGDERIRDFLTTFGRRLLRPAVARRYPELGSLGFFLRAGELDRALAAVAPPEGVLRFPRGLVFHVPPANVDTIFVYSWALSALAGNRNVVRISARSGGAAESVLDALNEALGDVHPAVRQTQRMVTYGHDDAVTQAFSAACDLRVIWGGDESVRVLRRHPLAPAARDLTFPDRSSFTVLSAPAWREAPAAVRCGVAEGLYNDVYWFDQAACASPRALLWVGDEPAVRQAHDELVAELAEVVRRREPLVDTAMAVQKRVATYGLAADGDAERVEFVGNAIASVRLTGPGALPRGWLGTGTLAYARVDALAEVAELIERRDQTLTYFGFTVAELTELAQRLAGRGVDRFVPVGQALSFSPVWDGYDLLREFTRLTTISATSAPR